VFIHLFALTYLNHGTLDWLGLTLIYFQGQENPAGGFICLGVVVIIIIALVISSNQKNAALAQARTAYQVSLSRLKSDPTNPDLRQNTLALGRIYSNLTRKKRGVTLFDEVALMNDINAACAGATHGSQNHAQTSAAASIEERLSRLTDLRSKDLIDEEEYRLRRQQILDQL
jgi:hypothetical protein